MKLPSLWRRKKNTPSTPSVTIQALQLGGAVALPSAQALLTVPSQYRTTSDRSLSDLSSFIDSATSVATTDTAFSDLASSGPVATDDERENEAFVDTVLVYGLAPCSPRWLVDHADVSAQRSRTIAQMGALREALASAALPAS